MFNEGKKLLDKKEYLSLKHLPITPDKSALEAFECTDIHLHPAKSGHELHVGFAPILIQNL